MPREPTRDVVARSLAPRYVGCLDQTYTAQDVALLHLAADLDNLYAATEKLLHVTQRVLAALKGEPEQDTHNNGHEAEQSGGAAS